MRVTGEAPVFRMELLVNAPIERSFAVLVERCHDWWPSEHRLGEADRVAVVLEPRVGGRWYERTSDGRDNEWGRVLEWHTPNRVSLSWQIGLGFVPEPNPDRASRVDVVFTAEGAGQTRVTVEHSEFERHGEGWESMLDAVSNERGWPGILPAFAQLAESRRGITQHPHGMEALPVKGRTDDSSRIVPAAWAVVTIVLIVITLTLDPLWSYYGAWAAGFITAFSLIKDERARLRRRLLEEEEEALLLEVRQAKTAKGNDERSVDQEPERLNGWRDRGEPTSENE